MDKNKKLILLIAVKWLMKINILITLTRLLNKSKKVWALKIQNKNGLIRQLNIYKILLFSHK